MREADPDPGSGAFFTLDPGWKKTDPYLGYAINITDNIYKRLVTIIWVKNALILCC
jgi:hypothetical protein